MSNSLDHSHNVVDQAALSAEHAIKAAQHATNSALDRLTGTVQDLRGEASPLLDGATAGASEFIHRGIDAVRDSSRQLREKAHQASDGTVAYIKEEPIKSVLYAAAAGAALVALISLLTRSRDRA
jgi:ElaB/YqjD/DUF883 family membrane-anchored ribosome-binding protein